MGFGISKFVCGLLVRKNIIEFTLRKKVFGFENALILCRTVDKNSIKSILQSNGATIGLNTDIETPLFFHNCQNFSNLIIGNNCHIGKNCFFDLREKIIIEDNVVISLQTTILTHIDLAKSDLSLYYPATSKPVLISNNSYIGANSVVLMGVTIYEKSFVAAGSVVAKTVPSYTMVAGVPAREIKKLHRKNLNNISIKNRI